MARIFKQGVNIVVDYGSISYQIPTADTTYQLIGGLTVISDRFNVIAKQEVPTSEVRDAGDLPVADIDVYLRTLLQ